MGKVTKINLSKLIGHKYPAADGGNYGIYVVGYIPEQNDLIVLKVCGGSVCYDKPLMRIDAFKASYRYRLS